MVTTTIGLQFDRAMTILHYGLPFLGRAALRSKQAVREAAQYSPAPVRRTLRPSSSHYTPDAGGAQRPLLPVAVGAMNIHDVLDRQTDRRRQTDR